jgi:hypothetical protein
MLLFLAGITLLGTKEWLSENMKMMQLNGVLVMDDLLGCCWPEAFYRLVTLAQRAQALGQKQQGTGLVSGGAGALVSSDVKKGSQSWGGVRGHA